MRSIESQYLNRNQTIMTRFVSTRGGITPVSFDEAVLQGFAADGGLFVPESIPKVTAGQLQNWAELSFQDLAYELLSLFIDRSIVPASDLKKIINDSFGSFEHPQVVNVTPYGNDGRTYIMELFHGPTLSFKDVAMGFLVNVMDYFLKRRGDHLNIVLATTGDTGPAAAWACAGKQSIDCWPLYPRGMISEQQERQMTTLKAANVHPVGVENCPDGGDDLDLVVAKLFADESLQQQLSLSSVNSINWCRVMVQAVHYFYGYYRVVDQAGDRIAFSVPSGAFGNLFGGYLARSMGLPVEKFICANNVNQALHTAFTQGVFAKKDLIQTLSSAIDIVVPYNFWRFLYYSIGGDSEKLKLLMDEFTAHGIVRLDAQTAAAIQDGFISATISDKETADTIKSTFEQYNDYLLDPHSAVAVAASSQLQHTLPADCKIVCLATAHPAKFPEISRKVLGGGDKLPDQGKHQSLEVAGRKCQQLRICSLASLPSALVDEISSEMKKH
jgi:threonine synthase